MVKQEIHKPKEILVANERVKQNLFSDVEVSVLKNLAPTSSQENITLEVTDIVTKSGIKDSDEVLRALYTLEGKSLVQPYPAGDFTSNSWKITDVGIKALDLMPEPEYF